MADFVPRDPGAPTGATVSNLAQNTAGVIRGPKQEPSAEGHKVVVDVAANGAFRLNVFFSPDGSAWYIASQTTAGGVSVDGGQANYTNSARLDITWGYVYKIEIYNISAGPINYAYNIRDYTVT